MKDRILKNWSLLRIMYVLIGGAVVAQGIIAREWPALLLGGYFVSMGVFSFGCAAGNCGYTPRRRPRM